jgi:tRNA threonylcarbamoyladenosine biosynthesis protein TsaE
MPKTRRLELPDPDATTRLAGLLAGCLTPGLCIWLCGDLGSGKTHLARGLLRALGWQGPVRSPTYTLVETYEMAPAELGSGPCIGTSAPQLEAGQRKLEAESPLLLYHFDLYRMASPEEWSEAGFDDLPDAAVRLIEWPERGGGLTPHADLQVVLAASGSVRTAAVEVRSEAGEVAWRKLESALRAQPDASALRWASAC